MNSTVSEQAEGMTSWLKSKWPFGVFVGGALIAFAGWLVTPAMENPYVRVGSNVLSVRLGCIPDSIRVTAPASHLMPTRAQLVIRSSQGARPFSLRSERELSGGSTALSLSMPADVAMRAVAALESSTNPSTHLVIEFRPAPFIDTTSVEIHRAKVLGNPKCAEVLHSEELAQAIDRGKVDVLRIYFPQERLSDLTRSINPALGVLFICTLMAWSVWLLLWLSFGLAKFSLGAGQIRKACVTRFGRAPMGIRSKGIKKFVIAEYLRIHRRFVFARVVGPAIGFLLTISSLIAGLHPMEQSAQNTFGFVSSLQIALVGTFVGLVVRVLAECAIRVHQRVLDKQLMALHDEVENAADR